MSQLLARLFDHATRQPDRPAYLDARDRALSYAELAGAVAEFADWLRLTCGPRAIVLLSDANSLDYPAAWLGTLCAGATLFAVSGDASEHELTRAADESRATVVVGSERACSALKTKIATRVLADDPPRSDARSSRTDPGGMLLLQSSGTTALPRIVRRTAASLDAAADAIVDAIDFTPADRALLTVPLSHSYGMEHGILAPVWAGASVRLCPLLPINDALRRLRDEPITILPGVPSSFEMLAAAAAGDAGRWGADGAGAGGAGREGGSAWAGGASRPRRAYSAGAPLPMEVFDAVAARLGVRPTQLYGASEIGSVTYNAPDEPFDPRSVGTAMKGVSVRICDPDDADGRPLTTGESGQVLVRADSMFSGYVDSAGGLIDGYFPTGDIGRLDAQGRLFITGRIKLLIDIGGLKVNPLEVEEVLRQHPAVAQCVVVSMRQSQTVNRLKAIVTPAQTGTPVPIDALRDLARSRLAAHKVPRAFEVRDALPISSTGKILRHLIEA